MLAGVTAVWAVMALYSRTWWLIVAAAVPATPLNLYFYYALRGNQSDAAADDHFGLGRTPWLLLAWITYALGAAGVLWAMMGW